MTSSGDCLWALMVRRDELNGRFIALLGRLRPSEQTVAEFSKFAENARKSRQGDAAARAGETQSRLDQKKQNEV